MIKFPKGFHTWYNKNRSILEDKGYNRIQVLHLAWEKGRSNRVVKINRAAALLRNLMETQVGPPHPSQKTKWKEVMKNAKSFLAEWEEECAASAYLKFSNDEVLPVEKKTTKTTTFTTKKG